MNSHHAPGSHQAHLRSFWALCLAWAAVLTLLGCGVSPGERVGQTAEAVCSTAAVSASSSTATAGTMVTWTATAGCDSGDVPEYQFWLQPPGADWGIVQAYSPSSSYAWDTTGLADGSYNVGLWVLATGSAAPYDSFSIVSFDIGSACSNGALAFSPSSPAITGRTVTLMASADCTGSPEYQYWMQAPGADWVMIQPYTTTGNYAWATSGLAAGSYNLGVRVRNQGSSAPYETFASSGFVLTTFQPCTGGALTTNPGSPESAGTAVTLTGSANCDGAPEYEFWVQPPGGDWGIVQPFSPSGIYFWDSTGLTAGDYGLGVWVRNQGSLAPYETFQSTLYTLD